MDLPNDISHWTHQQHPLVLKNKVIVITNDDLNQELEILIICDDCEEPISSSFDDANVFYECN